MFQMIDVQVSGSRVTRTLGWEAFALQDAPHVFALPERIDSLPGVRVSGAVNRLPFGVIALLACAGPARRAARVDPAQVFREE